ncbi:MAG: Abortive infection protein [Sphingomonas bacterium]|uniref:CPBP family intramembrane glutamic endopeptidase n=1 Tax=Sphingomonas bacterium TaxID=1895847 RepID=UPI0026072FD4|nr:CPBP family intramembrane glutamic endopeptidase [Sphingomonas bacterium]MDB5707406.1 Abortive infection protein [Sphingomonas bacterium]
MNAQPDIAIVASRRHTIILCAIVLAIAAAGYAATLQPPGGGSHGTAAPGGMALYLPLLIVEWGFFLYARAGLRRQGTSIARVISARPLTGRAWLIDIALGAGLFAVLLGVEWLLDLGLGSADNAGAEPLLVRRAIDIPLWIMLSMSAGFVEEFVFRGYLQRQFGALLRCPWCGVVAQALLFGLAHGYQGPLLVVRIAVLGLVFGMAAKTRQSLVPGSIAHAAMDVAGGLAAFR